MAAMIWNPALGAWQEAGVSKVWNEAMGAYEDTTGLTWNSELGAWEERWESPSDKHLWRNGIIPAMSSRADEENNGVGVVAADSYLGDSNRPYTAFAWQVYSENDAVRAGDDCWISQYTPSAHYLAFTFAGARHVEYVKVAFRATPISIYQPYAYIQYTVDGSAWVNLWYGRTNDGVYHNTETALLRLGKVIRAVRIYTPSGYSGHTEQKYLGAYAMQCYGK